MQRLMPVTNRLANEVCALQDRKSSACFRRNVWWRQDDIFLRKQKWSEGASEEELIDIAIRSMGLSELKPFDPKERIIEFKMESAGKEIARENELARVLQ